MWLFRKEKTEVIECLLAGCKHHDGKNMACSFKRISIGADGNCDNFEQLSDAKVRKKIRENGGSISCL